MSLAGEVAEVALALLLVVAALTKLTNPTEWRRTLVRYELPMLRSPLVLWVVPILELLIALLLILHLQPFAGVVAGTVLLAFAAVIFMAWRAGASGECGCFGELMSSPIGGLGILRALILSAIALTTAVPTGDVLPHGVRFGVLATGPLLVLALGRVSRRSVTPHA